MADSQYVVSIQPGYVLVEDPPDYDVVLSEQAAKLQAISAACTQSGYKNVLVRGTQANVRLTPAEMFKFGESVAKLGIKAAIVNSHDASMEDEGFLETVATNRGSPIRFFDNEQDARDWLGV